MLLTQNLDTVGEMSCNVRCTHSCMLLLKHANQPVFLFYSLLWGVLVKGIWFAKSMLWAASLAELLTRQASNSAS